MSFKWCNAWSNTRFILPSFIAGFFCCMFFYMFQPRDFFYYTACISLLVVSSCLLLYFNLKKRGPSESERFRNAMKIIASGSFDIPEPPAPACEISELYGIFYSTIKTLENHCIGLEKKITRRTVEIEQIHSQLIQAGKLAAVGELAAGIAHELNNPIGGILGYAQFILEKMSAGEKAFEANSKIFAQYMEFIARESQRCKTIIQNLLKFARSSGMEFSRVDINVVLADTVDIVQHQIRLDEIEFETRFYPALPLVMGDANQLQQVFLNILINAIKAIPQGSSGNIRIASSLIIRGGIPHVEIRIRDNGVGIAPENQNKIFYPFFTTRKTGDGTGLGLALSYGLIKEHRGDIFFESEVGKGTTFIITLPGENQ